MRIYTKAVFFSSLDDAIKMAKLVRERGLKVLDEYERKAPIEDKATMEYLSDYKYENLSSMNHPDYSPHDGPILSRAEYFTMVYDTVAEINGKGIEDEGAQDIVIHLNILDKARRHFRGDYLWFV